MMNRSKIINSLCAMFNDVHENQVALDWLIKLHNESDNQTLISRINNWRHNYPEQYNKHGIFVF